MNRNVMRINAIRKKKRVLTENAYDMGLGVSLAKTYIQATNTSLCATVENTLQEEVRLRCGNDNFRFVNSSERGCFVHI